MMSTYIITRIIGKNNTGMADDTAYYFGAYTL